ncbi:MAG: hypothetical protein AAF664_26490, partial [Planctomycetota bacterium]
MPALLPAFLNRFSTRRDHRDESRSTPMRTGDYTPIRASHTQRHRDLQPLSFDIIEQMELDGEVSLCLKTRSAPLQSVRFAWKSKDTWVDGVKARDKAVGLFVYRQLQRFWKNHIAQVADAQIYGWAAGEVTHRLTDSGLIEFNSFAPRHARDCRVLKRAGKHCGVRFSRIA